MAEKFKLGLALSGGGVKGFAHAGALKAMEENGMRPDVISGTSAGAIVAAAIVAALYSAGHSPAEICSLFKAKDFNNFVEFNIPKSGLFGISGFSKFLKENIKYKTFEELPIPIFVVATDLDNGRSVTRYIFFR